MARSDRLDASTERRIDCLLNDCLDLGDDAVAWQARLIDGLLALTGGLVANVGPVPPARPGRVQPVWEWVDGHQGGGWPSDAARDRLTAAFRTPGFALDHPAVSRFVARPEPMLTQTRRELVPDREWDRSEFVNRVLRANEIDEGLVSRAPVPVVGGGYLLTILRGVRERPFGVRDGRAVDALHRRLLPHLGRRLLLTTQPNLHGLSARHRQVLDRLLVGDSEKEAGLALGMSRATVHGYVKRLYAHFGVNSRAELLAYFLRRYRR
jgi:DNA-binding CsgD family transcriptional regulator